MPESIFGHFLFYIRYNLIYTDSLSVLFLAKK